MTGYLIDAAYVWLANERPDCRTRRDLRLPCGGKVDLAVIEDGRICGIFFWNAASDRSALVHLVTAAKAYLAEIWVLSTPAAVGELRGCLPLHVGFRVAKPGIVPALAMPATIGKPGVSDLLSLLHIYELRQLAATLDVSPSTTAVGAAGQLAFGKLRFMEMICEVLLERGPMPLPTKLEILRASRPRSVALPPVWGG